MRVTPRRRRRVAGAAAACVSAVLGGAATGRADELAMRLNAALDHPGLRGATVGVLVVRADDGRMLFERAADHLLVPASNLKILTALAALAAFGPTHRFTTRVSAPALPDSDGTVPALAVHGGGDPALTSEEWWRLAADLHRAGLRRVRGDLILDDSYFDQQRWNPAWQEVSARAFTAPVGALTANYGSFAVEVRTDPGGASRISIDPPLPFFDLVNRLKPGSDSLEITRESSGGRERVIVSGAVAGGNPVTVYRSVDDPIRYAAALFRFQLAAVGIAVDGADRLGAAPAEYRELVAFDGKPLADVLRSLMKYSNNNIAETLLKDLGAAQSGAPGTWPNGVAAARQQLATLGLPADDVHMVDGSGLSPADRVTPRLLVAALRTARASFAFGPEFVSALPIAGRDGTLDKRAAGAAGAVRAKTGLLATAAALSGYAHTRGGDDVIFSLLINDYQHGDAAVMAGIDGVATALVQ